MSCMSSCRSRIESFGSYFQSFVLLLLRVFAGFLFFQAGLNKFYDIDSVAAMFDSLGIVIPTFNAYFVAFVELVGGLFLFFGFLARFASFFLAITMVVALFTAHADATYAMIFNPWAHGFAFFQESPIPFLLSSLVIFAFGAGRVSLDALCSKQCSATSCER